MFSIFIFWNIGGDKIISKLFIALIDFKGMFFLGFHVKIPWLISFYLFLCYQQMPRTTNDKLFLGKEFISKLSSTDDCYSFHSGVKKCNCLKVDDIEEVKNFFIKKLRIFSNLFEFCLFCTLWIPPMKNQSIKVLVAKRTLLCHNAVFNK